MIKYYHEANTKEIDAYIKANPSMDSSKRIKIDWDKFNEDYPPPKWCVRYQPTRSYRGCHKLVLFKVKSEADCLDCECYRRVK